MKLVRLHNWQSKISSVVLLLRKWTHHLTWKTSASLTSREADISDTLCKPVFVQTLLDVTTNEGDKLRLRAAVNAHPEPEVRRSSMNWSIIVFILHKIIWYRNDIPLKNSRDLTLTFDGQFCTLVKERSDKENDTGIYRITAVNSMGQAESTCQVLVHSLQSPISRERLQSTRSSPIFLQPLQDQSIREGEYLLLRIQVCGQPKPQIIWYKDNKPLRNTLEHRVGWPMRTSVIVLIVSRTLDSNGKWYSYTWISTHFYTWSRLLSSQSDQYGRWGEMFSNDQCHTTDDSAWTDDHWIEWISSGICSVIHWSKDNRGWQCDFRSSCDR